ncbi:MAG: SGNH/GDSL hydrolase family protein [Pseudomonadota bacterium]|nr:SGNH/GDSL hydrolase family protein [Pseudomonadota bacterium]
MRRRLLFASVPVVLLVVGAEAVARLWPPPDPSAYGHPDGGGIMLAGNPLLAWELAPGARVQDGVPVLINAERFRDKERGPKGARPRVLSLGDSTVYGYQVTDDEVFTSVLESRFEAEFINGGVPGYSTEQALNLLALRGFALEPDVLLVATLWSDSNFDRFVDRDILARSEGVQMRWALSGWSALAGWAETWAVYRGQDAMRKVGWVTEDKAHGERRVPIADYAANLARLCTLMAERDGGVVFVTLPGRDDVVDTVASPEPWIPYRAVMRATAEACGAPLVDLAETFAAAGDPALMMDEVHPSVAGHALAATTIEAALRAVGWPATPLRAEATAAVDAPADPFATQGDTWFQGMRGPLRTKDGAGPAPGGGHGPMGSGGRPPGGQGGGAGMGGPGGPGGGAGMGGPGGGAGSGR